MTKKKKDPASAFTSFRIIGKKAQDILTKARTMKEKGGGNGGVPLPEPNPCPELVVHLSLKSVVKAAFAILAIVAGAWLFVRLRDTIILLLLSFFVAAIMDPGVRMMERRGLPRGIGILVQYVLALVIFVFLLFSLIPIIAAQIQQIAVFVSLQVDAFLQDPQISFPMLTDELNVRLTNMTQMVLQNLSIHEFTDALQRFGQDLSAFAQGSVRFATRLAGSVVTFFVQTVVVLVLAFFIQMEKEHIRTWVGGFFPARYRNYMDSKTEAIHEKIGQWARGQLMLALAIGILVFIALTILKMPYALTLAALAAFTEFIPYIGPFIAAVPAVLIAMTQEGFIWALIVIGVYYVIQWCENNLLVPLIMKRAVGLSPIAIIIAMLVGISFPEVIHPILGILVAVPATTIVALFLEDWRSRRSKDF